MSRTYESVLVVGCFLEDIDPLKVDCNDHESLREHLCEEWEMFCEEDANWIGFEVNQIQELTLDSAAEMKKVANKFKSVTGVTAKLKSCIYVY